MAMWLAWAILWIAGPVLAEDSKPSLYALIEQSSQALVAEKYAESRALIEQALDRPDFDHAEEKLQYEAFQVASDAAWGARDYLAAHEFLVASARYSQADGNFWWRRAVLASGIENWQDAALSLTAMAERWPKSLTSSRMEVEVVLTTVHELHKKPQLREQRKELLNALFDAQYKLLLGAEPSYLWLMLATDSLEDKDPRRAAEVARRIADGSVLIAMRIDKRFDDLTTREPRFRDIRAAAENSAERLQATMKEHPRSLSAATQYGYTLYELGRFKEMLAFSENIIARVDKAPKDAPPYDDIEDNLAWIHNHKASALRALGRWDEAADVLARWRSHSANSGDKASQAINLGFFYNEMGRAQDALQAIEGIDWARGMSPYGRTQFQFVRFQALQQLGRREEAAEIIDWFRKHEADAPGTAQAALMEFGDADAAAALLIANLRDVDRRFVTLAQIQGYAGTPRTERQKKLDALKESLLSRADVIAAIDAVGRRDRFPIHSMEY